MRIKQTHFNVRGPRLAVRRRGLTLIELLVTVGILVIMILTFGQIITASQKAVTTSQSAMRTCAAGAAIEKVIRDDLRKITRNGFLCITHDGNNTHPPQLVAVTAGITLSKTDPVIGNGGIIALGLCANQAGGDPVLYHQALVLANGVMATDSDVLAYDLESVVRLSRDGMNTVANSVANTWAPGGFFPSIRIPANDVDDITALWQVLASECYALSIMWANGDVDGSNNLRWFGIECDDNNTIDDPSDDSYNIVCQGGGTAWNAAFDSTDPNQIEFNADIDGNGSLDNAYRALWTKDNQSNWPVAIKIRFTISNPSVIGEGSTPREYEIVCPVGQ